MILRVVFRCTFCAVLVALGALATCAGQEATQTAPQKGKVILTKLGPVVYPQIARAAHIAGDVQVELEIPQDGTVESANAVSGPPLLAEAALKSARDSAFQCRNCTGTVTPYHLFYSFQLELSECDATPVAPSQAKAVDSALRIPTIPGTRVTITETVLCIVDSVTIVTKPRTWKCFYLWHCGR